MTVSLRAPRRRFPVSMFPGLAASISWPAAVDPARSGRVEMCIGRLGAGKTTWAALRATHLARSSGRDLFTTGVGWPEPWQPVHSMDALLRVRDAVLVVDEVHQLLPSTKGMLDRQTEKVVMEFLSLARKQRVCVLGPTQAWTRVATHFRQLVTGVWVCEPVKRGKLHAAYLFDHPDESTAQRGNAQWYAPSRAGIPTNAPAWTGHDPQRFAELLRRFESGQHLDSTAVQADEDEDEPQPATSASESQARPSLQVVPDPPGRRFWESTG